MEEICLGMKARTIRDEDSGVENAFGALLEIEKTEQGIGLGDLEIVARQDPDAAAAIEEVLEMPLEKRDSAFEDEGREEVGVFGLVEVAPEMGEKRVALAGHECGTEGCRHGPVEDAVRMRSPAGGFREQADVKV